MTNYRLIPTIGIENLPFGTPRSEIVRCYGTPRNDRQISNLDGWPSDRQTLDYGTWYCLITPEHGLISITIEVTDKTEIYLWDRDISGISASELQRYLESRGYATTIDLQQWDDLDLMAIDCGLIASFCQDVLESIELSTSKWHELT